MFSKIVWSIIIVAIVLGGLYMKFLYPGSQLQLEKSFRFVEAMPVEHFYNAPEKSCGIWYERLGPDEYKGSGNDQIKKCFTEAFEKCEQKSILEISDRGATSESSITYSYIKILRQNDQSECIIQHYFDEQKLAITEGERPLYFINTCTVLADDFFESCEPLYIKDQRKSNDNVIQNAIIENAINDNQQIDGIIE
ncbi:hypothetical protein HN643_05805 [Candidatus Falkowbacteria bacterium]|jgi:hypothetical protein|nr:hypothetical protein [Candidatus Falkowbacteria bacterium]MBT5502751.1 hypothetical protein [Candidatus Falkowbacteria bacterium]MBT6573466.1 hypothetical protein [Candidatus Falkowbacteria bacterium]MBT7501149.1 hypothetical protein [Candidatus Falkowbacteria bacterium]